MKVLVAVILGCAAVFLLFASPRFGTTAERNVATFNRVTLKGLAIGLRERYGSDADRLPPNWTESLPMDQLRFKSDKGERLSWILPKMAKSIKGPVRVLIAPRAHEARGIQCRLVLMNNLSVVDASEANLVPYM
jgi:hypothetical protein